MAPGPKDASGAPLQAAAPVGATLDKDVHTAEWNGQKSTNSFHVFVNETAEPLELSWGDELRDNAYGTVQPHANMHVGTYDFHTWRVRSKSRGLIVKYTGPSTILTITPDGYFTEQNTTLHTTTQPQPQQQQAPAAAGDGAAAAAAASSASAAAVAAAGSVAGRTAGPAPAVTPGAGGGANGATEPGYRQRSSVLGMPIWAFDCVSDAAVSRLAAVVGAMLAHSPPALLERLVAGGGSFAVFGSGQVVSDVPAHRFMRYNTGRDLDKTARGLGATPTVPVTSCGEENLTMQGDRWYPCQSILIHEVGHMIHNMGLGPEGVAAVLEAYRAAVKARLYPTGCYMVTNEQEYWAVAVESWFESTIRDDVNGGIRTRAGLRKHDPALAALLAAAFGDGEWRYWKDCPRPLAMPSHRAAAAAAAAAAGASAGGAAGATRGSSSSAAAAAAAPPSWRARRPTKLVMEALMEGGDTTAGGTSESPTPGTAGPSSYLGGGFTGGGAELCRTLGAALLCGGAPVPEPAPSAGPSATASSSSPYSIAASFRTAACSTCAAVQPSAACRGCCGATGPGLLWSGRPRVRVGCLPWPWLLCWPAEGGWAAGGASSSSSAAAAAGGPGMARWRVKSSHAL